MRACGAAAGDWLEHEAVLVSGVGEQVRQRRARRGERAASRQGARAGADACGGYGCVYVGELERASRGTAEVAKISGDQGLGYAQNAGFVDGINKGTKTGRSMSSPRVLATSWFNWNAVETAGKRAEGRRRLGGASGP